MKIVKRNNYANASAYNPGVEFDFEEFEPGDIVIARMHPNSIQVVRKVVPTGSPYYDNLHMETLWRFDNDFSSTKKREYSTKYRLATRSDVETALTLLGNVLNMLR